jgi:hypothetical protein
MGGCGVRCAVEVPSRDRKAAAFADEAVCGGGASSGATP